MKKFALLFAVVLSITLLFSACTPSYNWEDAEKDVECLTEAGFEIFVENTPEELEEANSLMKIQLQFSQKEFTVEIVNVYGLKKTNDFTCGFEEFASEIQAQQMYDYYKEISSLRKVVRLGRIVIHTNSEDAIELLGYDFK